MDDLVKPKQIISKYLSPSVEFHGSVTPKQLPPPEAFKELSRFWGQYFRDDVKRSAAPQIPGYSSGELNKFLKSITELFSSYKCLGNCFLKEKPSRFAMRPNCKEEMRQLEGEEKDSDCTSESKDWQIRKEVDIILFHKALNALLELDSETISKLLTVSLLKLAGNIMADVNKTMLLSEKSMGLMFNSLLLAFEIDSSHIKDYPSLVFPRLAEATTVLPLEYHAKLARYWVLYSQERLEDLLKNTHLFINLRLDAQPFYNHSDRFIESCSKFMKIIYYANLLYGKIVCGEYEQEDKTNYDDPLAQILKLDASLCKNPLIPFKEFVNEKLSEYIDLPQDYDNFLHGYICKKTGDVFMHSPFSYLDHPFLLNPTTKAEALYLYRREEIVTTQSLSYSHLSDHFLMLRVRRDSLPNDTFQWLDSLTFGDTDSLKKPLMVEFIGEKGVDSGGVSNELFRIVTQDLLKPEFGLFTKMDETETYWFNSMTYESDHQFYLIGILIGLAAYNQIVIELHFPGVLYRKLFGQRGCLQDLKDLSPTMYNSLLSMLEFTEDNFEEVFFQTFRVWNHDMFGNLVHHDLIPDGDDILVTRNNCQNFVDLYVDHLLNTSVEKQFKAFFNGFKMVIAASPVEVLFRPDEIDELLVGSNAWDIDSLKETTTYFGYTETSPIIVFIWEVLRELKLKELKDFLAFVTGSHCIPTGGLNKVNLAISRSGGDSDLLPTAQTCFNILHLPDYSSKEKLEKKLKISIKYSYGFGLI